MSHPIEESQIFEGLSVLNLKMIGLWNAINTYLTTRKRSRGLNLLLAHSILFAIPYIVCQALGFFYIKIDLKITTFLFLNCVPCLQVMAKALVFWIRINEQADIYTLLRRDFLKCIPVHKRKDADEIYKKSAKSINIACLMAFFNTATCVSTRVIKPGVKAQDMTGAVSTKVLGGWYPFSFSRSPWFEVIFVYESLLLLSHGSLISFFECVMVQPLLCLCAHFKVLGYHISTLKITDVVHSKAKDGSEYLNDELRAILSDYEMLLRYAATIQSILNFLVTVILGTGIVILIIGILQLMFDATDIVFVIHSLTYVCYQATEVFLICVSSSALETASGDLRFALYSSDWYMADKKFRVGAQMMMIRAMKPLTLTAIKMYPVNLEILLAIFQFTYTAAMVLTEKKN